MEESLADMALRIADRFIEKVESGRARSIETYEEMKRLRQKALDEKNSTQKKDTAQS